MLELKNVSKSYMGKEGRVRALRDVNLTLEQGEIVGLIGENGAGKSTMLKCILGYLPCRGEILLDGRKIDRNSIARLSFATCEHSYFPNLTPVQHREFYEMHFGAFRAERFRTLMDFFELPSRKQIKHFSTGQKNQFEVIMALCQGAEYILMDEPFAGNDVFNREDFYKVLLGILEPTETVFLSTHLIGEVENFLGRAVLLHKGRVAADVTTLELEERGKTLLEFVKETYNYRADRVQKALAKV